MFLCVWSFLKLCSTHICSQICRDSVWERNVCLSLLTAVSFEEGRFCLYRYINFGALYIRYVLIKAPRNTGRNLGCYKLPKKATTGFYWLCWFLCGRADPHLGQGSDSMCGRLYASYQHLSCEVITWKRKKLCGFETGSCCVTQASLKLMIPLPPKRRNCKHALTWPTFLFICWKVPGTGTRVYLFSRGCGSL